MLKLICPMIVLAAAAWAADPVGTISVKPELIIAADGSGDACLFARGLGDSVIVQCAVDVGTVNISIEHFVEALVKVNTAGVQGSFRNIRWLFTRKDNGELDFDIIALKLEQTGALPPVQ